MPRPVRIALGLCLALAASSAHGQSMPHDHGAHTQHGAPAAGDTPATAAFKASDDTMMKDMAVPYTGNVDVDFRTHMIPHHRGAIDMAKVVLAHSKDPATRALAEKIIADQEKEIAEMQDWLKVNAK